MAQPSSHHEPRGSDLQGHPNQTERSATVLIVDDEPIARVSLRGRLRSQGYEILEADNGQQGMSMARLYRPDLIIVDWMMPEMDGPTLCEAIRADSSLRTTQLILMTSNDHPAQIAEGLARGADDFLSKSSSSQEVFARVHAGLRTHDLLHQLEQARNDLDHSYQMLHSKQQELESELRSAAKFMSSLLPLQGEPIPGLRVAWRYLPSLALGGDLFNVTRWSDHEVGLYILDASGHGVAAALRAASLMTFLRADSLLRQVGSYDPAAILTEVNRRFPISADGDYFTLWIGCLDMERRELRFSTGGHAGAHWMKGQGHAQELSHPAFPIGMRPDTTYQAEMVPLESGDRLFLYSDGLYEIFSKDGESWGQDRLKLVLADGFGLPLPHAIDETIRQARCWQCQEHFLDDAAIVGLQIP